MTGFETLAAIDRRLGVEGTLEASRVFRDRLEQDGLVLGVPLSSFGEPAPERYGLSTREFVFPGLRVLGLPVCDWLHRAHRAHEWPSFEFFARIPGQTDRAAHFGAVVSTLGALGEHALEEQVSRVTATFEVGLLTIRVQATRPGVEPSTDRERAHPELLESANVSVYCPVTRLAPDPDLADRIARAQRLPVAPLAARLTKRFHHVHAALRDEQQGVWLDADGLGFSRRRVSVVLPRRQPLVVRLTEVRPARGRGGASLALSVGSGDISVATSDVHTALREQAARLSEALGVELETRAYDAD